MWVMWGMRGTWGTLCGAGGDVLVSSPLVLSLQARRTYRKYFRSSASTCLANFIYRRLVSGAGGEGTTLPSQPPALLGAPVLR